MQDRFHAIIKRRLRAEIERNPPLFPWETRLWDYESEQSDWMAADAASIAFWTAQLQTVKLPIPMPETLLRQIFAECRKVAHSSLREGIKLVRAVEGFFPDEPQALNHWAGQVLAEPARSPGQTLAASNLPQTYELANPTQQMVLSLLAARQMLEAMTLEVSVHCPQTQRQWLTAVGALVLEVDYQPEADRLRVQGHLPGAGHLTLRGPASQATATCTTAETLTVELSNLLPQQVYPLEVRLDAADQSPLVFGVYLNAEDA